MRKRILLIEPPFYRLFKYNLSLARYPLSLGYLSSCLKRNTSWDVLCYNADFYPKETRVDAQFYYQNHESYLSNLNNCSYIVWQELKQVIVSLKPDVIGISAKSQNFASALKVARIAKQINKETIIIMGGPHITLSEDEAIKKYSEIDITVKGEGEYTLIDVLLNLENGKLKDVKGISFRDKNKKLISNPPRAAIRELDFLPFPSEVVDEVLLDYNSYPRNAFSFIITSRGCPYNCFFCGSSKIWGKNIRYRSVNNVIKEIKLLKRRGIRVIHFDDDIFALNFSYLKQICKKIREEKLNIIWSCELHLKQVNTELLKLLKGAGCYLIQVGIESGDNTILQKIGKKITIEEAKVKCELIKKMGFELHAFFMAGFPWEAKREILNTIKAIKEIKADQIIFSIFTPYPGTDAFELCKEHGLITKDYDPSLHHHQSPSNSFSFRLPAQELKSLLEEVIKVVRKKNKWSKFRQIFSSSLFHQIRQCGISSLLGYLINDS